MLALGIIRLRQVEGLPKQGQFKTPLVPLLPILSIVICLSFMFQYDLNTWMAFGFALVVGILIYILYGYKHSEVK